MTGVSFHVTIPAEKSHPKGGAPVIHGGGVWDAGNPADWLDFSANLRPEEPPEWVTDALRSTLGDIRFYPDLNMTRARRGLAAFTGLPEAQILPTAGGTAAIDLALSHLKGCVYTEEHPFGEYIRRAEANGRRHTVWDGSFAAGDTLILANPDNPSGRVRTREEMLSLYDKLRCGGAEMVADEAFIDYCPEHSLRRHIAPGLIIAGSLTKILGIPGVRLGFLCADPETVHTLQERMLPWSLSAQASEIAARLPEHKDEIRKDAETNRRRREAMAGRLEALGAAVAPSGSNFLLADFHRDMIGAAEMLKAQGILVRTCASFGLGNRFLRLAVRTEKENERLINALEEILYAR